MKGLYSVVFLFSFSILAWSKQKIYLGWFELDRDLASFDAEPPVKGAHYRRLDFV